MKILILCTGNSCRSQMAEGFLKAFDSSLNVFSAGTNPSESVNPNSIQVMDEIGINITQNHAKSVNQFLTTDFDYVITVCGGAKETCPIFIGNVKNTIHIGFEDPADALGTEEEVIEIYRTIRNEILRDFFTFYNKKIRK